MTTAPAEYELYRNGNYHVIAWLERRLAEPPALYVKIEQRRRLTDSRPGWSLPIEVWSHVKTYTDVRVKKQPWWSILTWHKELQAVIEDAIEWCEEQADQEESAEATLQAVAEAMQAAAPLLARPPLEARRS